MKLLNTSQPNRFICRCGFPFLISQKVLARTLDCLNCGRAWSYVRNRFIPTIFETKPRGAFMSLEEREIIIAKKGLQEANDIAYRKARSKEADDIRV